MAETRLDARAPVIEDAPCPVCGGDDHQPLHWATDRWMGGPGRFRYARCQACRHVYLRRRPAPAEMGRYYPPGYIRTGRAPRWLRHRFRRYDQAPRVALTRGQPGRRVLDVGCARGDYLAAMRDAGWIVAGVEPTSWLADRAAARGLPVWPAELGSADLPEGAFDVATMWDVLEHLADPRGDLERLSRVLRPDGRLIVATPVLDGWDARLFGEGWSGWDTPRHLSVFSRMSLERLLAATGFEVVTWAWTSESYLLTALTLSLLAARRLPPPLAAALRGVLHLRPVRLLMAPLFRLADRRLGGSAVTVVARRVEAR